MSRPPTLRARILALAAAPAGVTNVMVQLACATTSPRATAALCQLTQAGQLHTDTAYPWPWRQKRWFASRAALLHWLRAHPACARTPVRLPGTPTFAPPVPGPGSSAPLRPHMHPRAVFTRCPSVTHDVRYQLPPGARVPGGFAAIGIGHYLPELEQG